MLVAGLLLIGLVADDDGLFAAAGHRLARLTRHGSAMFIGAAVLIGVVTAILNLDTSVAFLTPVLVYLARSRGSASRRWSTAACCCRTPAHCCSQVPI